MGVLVDEVSPNVIEVRLNWPETRNAVGVEEAVELVSAIEHSFSSPNVNAIVLTAEGSSFCSGGDLRSVLSLATQGEDAVRTTLYSAFQRLYRTITDCPIPIIAVVEGPAVGFGCDLALACDVRVAGPSASFRYGWAPVGLISAVGGLMNMRREIGASRTWECIAGLGVSQKLAMEYGLAVGASDARKAAIDMGEALATFPHDVVVATKALLNAEPSEYLDKALDFQVGFITSSEFAERATRILGRTNHSSKSPSN
jgi:enoyl-CoA hydratase/carnithine racemase